MMKNIYYSIFKTKLGWMVVASTDLGLKKITLPASSEETAIAASGLQDAIRDDSLFTTIIMQIRTYFDGKMVEFHFNPDLNNATDFQKSTWQLTRSIPYGQTRSYLWIAEKSGHPRAARAVGSAMACNPLPIVIPCHRIIKSDCSMGGYGGGLLMKKYLLDMENNTCHSENI